MQPKAAYLNRDNVNVGTILRKSSFLSVMKESKKRVYIATYRSEQVASVLK
jgi:hypothetical protein